MMKTKDMNLLHAAPPNKYADQRGLVGVTPEVNLRNALHAGGGARNPGSKTAISGPKKD